MNEKEEHRVEAHSRTRLLIGVGLSALAVAGIATVVFWPGSDHTAEPPVLEPVVVVTPAAPAPPTALGTLEDTAATDVIAHVLEISIVHVETADDLGKLMENVAANGYLAELENQWQELVANGWAMDGSPTVVSTEIHEVSDTSATVTACIDSSNVRTLDADGNAIGAASGTRALNTFALEQSDDGIWRITSHSFPNDPAC